MRIALRSINLQDYYAEGVKEFKTMIANIKSICHKVYQKLGRKIKLPAMAKWPTTCHTCGRTPSDRIERKGDD